jgi:hypothetical protein
MVDMLAHDLRRDIAELQADLRASGAEIERLRATLKLESEYRRNAVTEATRLRAALKEIRSLTARQDLPDAFKIADRALT